MSSTYRDLIVWQRAMDLIERIYRLSQRFPREELYGLTSQTRRAAVSMVSNIAEGQGRMSPSEFRYFVGMARGSASEVETQLLIAERLGYVDAATIAPGLQDCDEIRRMLHGLAQSLSAAAGHAN